MNRLARSVLSASFVLLFATGCGSSGGEENPQEQAAPDVQMCEVMSASEVQPRIDPIADGRSLEPVTPGLKSCSYRIEAVDQLEQVRGMIDFTYFDTADEAQTALQGDYDNAISAGLTHVEWVSGFGDKAFISQEGETVGIKVVRGRLKMQINVGKALESFDALADVVRKLTARALEKMPAVS